MPRLVVDQISASPFTDAYANGTPASGSIGIAYELGYLPCSRASWRRVIAIQARFRALEVPVPRAVEWATIGPASSGGEVQRPLILPRLFSSGRGSFTAAESPGSAVR